MTDGELKELMGELATHRLNYVLENDVSDEESEMAFKQGIQAYNAYLEFAKHDDSHEEEIGRQVIETEKLEREDEIRVKESKKDRIIRGIELGLTVVVAPIIGYTCNKKLTKFIGTVEQMETFTSTPGRAIGKMFKFGK